MSSPKVFSGGPQNTIIHQGGFGRLVYSELLKLDQDEVGHIDAESGEEMTNGQFLKFSQQIAAGLKKLGCGTGDIVAVLGENSFRNSAVATACILLNAAFAPLDPTLKIFELKSLLASYKPKLIFCNLNQSKDIIKSIEGNKELYCPPILLDADESVDSCFGFSTILSAGILDSEPDEIDDPTNTIAFVIPSSGSTGTPKGVALSHRAAASMLGKFKSKDGSFLNPGGNKEKVSFLQTSHLFWMSGLSSLLMSYLNVKRVFMPKLENDKILNAIRKYKPTITFMPPSELVTALKKEDLPRDVFKPLKILTTAGGSLPKFVRDQLPLKVDNPPILLMSYGLSENVCTVTRPAFNAPHGCVGYIDYGITLKIVDPDTQEPLSYNKTGEVRVLNKYTFMGYVGDEDATKEAYDEEGYLKTGDLGYVTEDNLVFLMGRLKNVLKYRNVQVSPTSIEELLIEHPGVADAGVDGIPDVADQYHIIALIVKAHGSNITEDDVHRYMEENMSDSNKLRGGVKFVDRIPRNPHGKVKRAELKELALKLYKETATQKCLSRI